MFMNFIEIGHNHLLKHPLCESFLYLKWLKVRKFFFISLIFHLVFTVLHTCFVLQVYSRSGHSLNSVLSAFCHQSYL